MPSSDLRKLGARRIRVGCRGASCSAASADGVAGGCNRRPARILGTYQLRRSDGPSPLMNDALRFGVGVDDLHRIAWQANGILWERVSDGTYHPLPRLLTDFRTGALPGRVNRPGLRFILL
jgi:hypothetical protein